jgi:ATP-dependent DNA helicase RecG
MDIDELNAILGKNENEHIEFKAARDSYSKNDVADYTIALANERGGYLILGVTDKKPHKIVGSSAFPEQEKLKKWLLDVTHLRVDIQELMTPKGRVVIFQIPSRPLGMPYHRDGRYLMRSGESVVPMTADMLQRIFNETGPDFSAELCPKVKIDELDINAIEDFRKRWIKKSGNKALAGYSVEQLLIDAELLVEGKLNYAALILFGTKECLGKHLGNSELIFEYKSTDNSESAEQRENYRKGFFSFYDDLWNKINLRNPKRHYQEGLFIWDIEAFNESAIREAILNAVSHRDYRMPGPIFVHQFSDKIEINNPGGLPAGITFENILWQTAPRNRRLAETFEKCGLVERSGQGMNRIFESCIQQGKGIPDFSRSDADNFWICLNGQIRHPEFLRVLERIGEEQVASFSTDDFVTLDAIYNDEPLAARLQPIAKKLFDIGLLERTPKSKGHRIILAKRLYNALGKSGVHTRKLGLERPSEKALLLQHIQSKGAEGAKLKEMRQVLTTLNRSSVQVLLRELRDENKVYCKGKTSAGIWFARNV